MIKRPTNSLIVQIARPNYEVRDIYSTIKWALGSSAFMGSSLILSHTLLKDVSRYLQELRRNGQVVQTSKEVLSLTDKVMEDLKFTSDEKNLVQPIVTSSMHMQSIGSIDSIFGTYLLVPDHVNSLNPRNCFHDRIKILKEIGLSKDDIAAIQDSFVLSENAKLYTIARQLFKSRTCKSYILEGIAASLISFGSICTPVYLLNTFLVYTSIFNKCVVMILCFSIGFLLFQAASFVIAANEDKQAEHFVCELGEKYISGGIESCEKTLQREAILNSNDLKSCVVFETEQPLSIMPYSDRLSLLNQFR